MWKSFMLVFGGRAHYLSWSASLSLVWEKLDILAMPVLILLKLHQVKEKGKKVIVGQCLFVSWQTRISVVYMWA